MQEREPTGPSRGLPLNHTVRPDTKLPQRELRWTAASMLAVAALGQALTGSEGAAIGASIGFLIQQAGYTLIVRRLWLGWNMRTLKALGPDKSVELARVTLRAFTVWMRTADTHDRMYIVQWTFGIETGAGADPDEDGDAAAESRDWEARRESRIEAAYELAWRLGNEPLRCDNNHLRRLRVSLQRDEMRLLQIATGKRIEQ